MIKNASLNNTFINNKAEGAYGDNIAGYPIKI
jgi:hypothetical protein